MIDESEAGITRISPACERLDNRAAGRTAGYLVGRFIGARKGKVAMIAGSLSYRGHEESEMGFLHPGHGLTPGHPRGTICRSYLDAAPGLPILPARKSPAKSDTQSRPGPIR